jgi:hypothetical protein
MQRSRCRVLPKRRGRLASTGLSSRQRSDASDLSTEIHEITCTSCAALQLARAQALECKRRSSAAPRCGQILLLFRLRSEAAPRKVFPAGLPIACLLMTTHTEATAPRALIVLISPASPDPEPRLQIIAGLGRFSICSATQLGCRPAGC